MKSYFKLALKVLARRKFFTFISLFGISMTLVVLMVATAVLDNFYAPRAPESRFGRVLAITRVTERGPHDTQSSEAGYALLDGWMRPLHNVERTSIFSNVQSTAIYRGNSRIDIDVKHTDGDYWKILDFHFLDGRPYSPNEDSSGAHVAVVTDYLSKKLFDDVHAVGKTFTLEGDTYTVIGVVPRVSLTRLAAYSDAWVPIGALKSSDYRHNYMGGFIGLVLAHSRSDFPRLKAEYKASLRNFPLDKKTYTEIRTGLDTPFESTARDLTQNRTDNGVWILIAGVIFAALLFMTLPILNLVTLNLSRIMERAPEIGVRKAFGASRPALVSQFVIENIVLTVIGGLAGFVLAIVALRIANDFSVVPGAVFEMNARVFAYGMLIAVFFGSLSGVYPAWRMSRLDPVLALRGGAA
ncbi:MAG TPA: ABC transporter permease [Thermoanaerobaculia bacterium]|jgi:putative ABC transport system permease protein